MDSTPGRADNRAMSNERTQNTDHNLRALRQFPTGELARNTAARYRAQVTASGDRAELAAIVNLPDAAVAAISLGIDPTEFLTTGEG